MSRAAKPFILPLTSGHSGVIQACARQSMSEMIIQLNKEIIKGQLKELVRCSVEETLNELLEAEAEKLNQAA